MPTREQVLATARAELGTTENPPGSNRTKYGAWYGMNGVPWCAIFISWVAYKAGATSIIPRHAYTPDGADWFRKRGQWHTTPRAGDVVYFDFPGDGVDRISHVGFVEAVRADGRIVTIEGNTSTADNRNGGSVMRRVRSRSSVVGYGRPAYAASATPKPRPRPQPYPLPQGHVFARDPKRKSPTRHDGRDSRRDADCVERIQRAVGAKPDGFYGPITAERVTAYQRRHKLEADGIVGPRTWRSLA